VAQPLYCRYQTQVEGVARVVGKGSYAALAKHNVVVAFTHYVLGGHQEFLERRGHASFEQNRFVCAPRTLKQREILHIAGADLDHVGIVLDEIE